MFYLRYANKAMSSGVIPKKHRNLLRKISLDSLNALAVFMRMKPARIESARTFNAGNAGSLG
jgi:hypothetical protein